jgi:plasmid replication initiation protein
VLAIDPAYFRLTGGVERWLYRVARKHAGRQTQGWVFDIPHLHQKSGSLARLADFAFDIRLIVRRQPLPGYRLRIEREGRRELLRILPTDLSTAPVDKPVETLGTSGVSGIGTSGVALSGLRECGGQLTLWPQDKIPAANLESNRDSNFCLRPAGVENTSERSRTPKLLSEKNTPDTTFRKSGFTDDVISAAPLPFGESEGRAS